MSNDKVTHIQGRESQFSERKNPKISVEGTSITNVNNHRDMNSGLSFNVAPITGSPTKIDFPRAHWDYALDNILDSLPKMLLDPVIAQPRASSPRYLSRLPSPNQRGDLYVRNKSP